MSASAAPIGIFDSGIGGLTVVRELVRQLPRESIVYFGDTARLPYGSKSPETVRRYSREIAGWLEAQGIKMLVVACNTASAHALDALRASAPIPVVGVIDPGARTATHSTRTGRIGVIGTAGTIGSGAYERAIRALAPAAVVTSVACPLFVPLVEEGWLDTEATRLIAQRYLTPILDAGADTLVLGCTHYPLLAPLLGELLGPAMRLVDGSVETAGEARRLLEAAGLAAPHGAPPSYRFAASDEPGRFLRLGQRFLGNAIERVDQVTLP